MCNCFASFFAFIGGGGGGCCFFSARTKLSGNMPRLPLSVPSIQPGIWNLLGKQAWKHYHLPFEGTFWRDHQRSSSTRPALGPHRYTRLGRWFRRPFRASNVNKNQIIWNTKNGLYKWKDYVCASVGCVVVELVNKQFKVNVSIVNLT